MESNENESYMLALKLQNEQVPLFLIIPFSSC